MGLPRFPFPAADSEVRCCTSLCSPAFRKGCSESPLSSKHTLLSPPLQRPQLLLSQGHMCLQLKQHTGLHGSSSQKGSFSPGPLASSTLLTVFLKCVLEHGILFESTANVSSVSYWRLLRLSAGFYCWLIFLHLRIIYLVLPMGQILEYWVTTVSIL